MCNLYYVDLLFDSTSFEDKHCESLEMKPYNFEPLTSDNKSNSFQVSWSEMHHSTRKENTEW